MPEIYDYEQDGFYYMNCYNCGGDMVWCFSCEVWNQICCVEYGTCLCS